MSAGEQEKQSAEAVTQTKQTSGPSLLQQAIKATKLTTEDRAQDLLRVLVEQAQQGTVSYKKDVIRSIAAAVAGIDATVSKQLAAIMHHAEFQKLEGTWRGLHHLVMNSETGTQLKLRVLNCSKNELKKDLEKAVEFDQSQLFKKLYTNEFGTPGGKPYGALIGDFEFRNHPDDIGILNNVSTVAAAAFCPFISAASPGMFGLPTWTDLPAPRDLAKIFDSVEYTQWTSFRESEDSRFVVLTMPRTLARLPYGSNTKPIDEFHFEEVPLGKKGESIPVEHDQYCWMNTAYVLGTRLTSAFSEYGWCTRIRGAQGGGKVEGLPAHIFQAEDGDMDLKCPTEVQIADRREKEISDLGFYPLSHYKDTDYSVFFGGQTTQKPKKYDRPAATENAQISARLPYIMATSRFAHYLKVIARDWIGDFKEQADLEKELNRWIMNYVSADPNPAPEQRARYPLAEAKIKVEAIPGQSGAYNAVAWLRPWLQLEELNTSLRMVARIPKME